MSSSSARRKFQDVFAIIKAELVEHFKSQGMPEEAVQWYADNLEYNTPGGKLNRGMSVVDSYQVLKGSPLTDDEYKKAAVLGWCVELLQAFFLVADDIMDASITRRDQPCWYKKPNVGLIAINDSYMLESSIYYLLKLHFKNESYYVDLIEEFHDASYKTETGQLIDLITAPIDEVDLAKFSLTKHRLIVVYKTAFYSFYLPVALAMRIAKIPQSYPSPSPSPNYPAEIKPYDVALSILLDIGEYFQIQDDFLDYYVSPEKLGKVGTDILDNKCSWVVNTAIAVLDTSSTGAISSTPPSYALSSNGAFQAVCSKLSSETKTAMRATLDENYGRKDSQKEKRVKDVFNEIGIAAIYEEYEEGIYKRLIRRIDEIPEGEGNILRRDVLKMFLNKIYKRQK